MRIHAPDLVSFRPCLLPPYYPPKVLRGPRSLLQAERIADELNERATLIDTFGGGIRRLPLRVHRKVSIAADLNGFALSISARSRDQLARLTKL